MLTTLFDSMEQKDHKKVSFSTSNEIISTSSNKCDKGITEDEEHTFENKKEAPEVHKTVISSVWNFVTRLIYGRKDTAPISDEKLSTEIDLAGEIKNNIIVDDAIPSTSITPPITQIESRDGVNYYKRMRRNIFKYPSCVPKIVFAFYIFVGFLLVFSTYYYEKFKGRSNKRYKNILYYIACFNFQRTYAYCTI